MKYRLFLVLSVALIGLMAMGAKGCSVWAETNSATYEINQEGQGTLFNESGQTIYLPGCSQFSLEKLVDGQWEDRGPNVQCIWEGVGVPVPTSDSFVKPFSVPGEMGTWRLHYIASWGCDEDQPLSQANCDGQEDVYTPEFEVAGQVQPTCGDLGGIDFGMCEMFLGWSMINGTCQGVSGCGGQGFQFFSSELECLSQCETDCADWSAAHGVLINQSSQCDSANECTDVPQTSCGCTRNLVVNSSSDIDHIMEFYSAMGDAGCGIITTCDCPPADGFACNDGTCSWNYL